MKYAFGHATDVGRVRDHNEDNYIALPEQGLWVVADGMGGHAAGEVASAIAVECIAQKAGEGMPLAEAIEAAHSAITEAGKQGRGTPGMGCTVVALQLSGSEYEIAWVGDSRAYLWNGALRPLTRDHSFVQQLIDSGAISEEEARVHPQRSVITQALGASDLKTVRVDSVRGTLCRGEQILLCSDGLTGEVEDRQISALLQQAASPQQAVDELINTANRNGGSDNVTVILLEAPANAPKRRGKGDTVPMQAIVPEQKVGLLRRLTGKLVSIKTWLLLAVLLTLILILIGWLWLRGPAPVTEEGAGRTVVSPPRPGGKTGVAEEASNTQPAAETATKDDSQIGLDNNLESQIPDLPVVMPAPPEEPQATGEIQPSQPSAPPESRNPEPAPEPAS